MEQSPVIDYYPLQFETDLNGKMQPWEAVVLIPFIDEVCGCLILVIISVLNFAVIFLFRTV